MNVTFIAPELVSTKVRGPCNGSPCSFYDWAICKIIKNIQREKDIDQKAIYATDLYALYKWAMKHPDVFAENANSIKYIDEDSPYLKAYETSEYYEDLCDMAELHNMCLDRALDKMNTTYRRLYNYTPILCS